MARFVSVVLPCYNGADTLAVQLDALTRQTYDGDWELVFVDNGSTDASATIAASYRDRIPNLKIVSAYDGKGARGGVAHSYTVGWAAAKGDPILVCESDDEVADDWLERMVDALKTADFAAPVMDYDKLNPPELSWGNEKGQQTAATGFPTHTGPLFLPYATCCATGMRRYVYEKVGNPDDTMGPPWDTDYSWRVQLAGYQLTLVENAVVHYRLRHGARARFLQAYNWGDKQLNLQLRYGMTPWPRYLAYCLYGLAQRGANLVFGTLSGKRPFSFWVWHWGFARGQLNALPRIFMAQMRGQGKMRDGAWKEQRGETDQSVRSA